MSLSRPQPRRLGVVAGLLVLTLAGLVLRLVGIDYGLPHRMEPDGLSMVRQAEVYWADGQDVDAKPPGRAYSTLIARVAGWTPDPRRGERAPRTLEEHLQLAAAPHLRMRVVVACLSTLIVPGTWLLARFFLGLWPAFLAAGFAAVSLTDVYFSQQARPHAPAAAFALLAVVAAVHARRRADFYSSLLAGAAAGLAIGTLQSGAVVLGSLLCACIFARGRSLPRGVAHFVLALGALAAVALPLLPLEAASATAASDPEAVTGEFFHFFGHKVYYDLFRGAGFGVLWKALLTFETVITALGISGIALWLFGGRRVRAAAGRPEDRRGDLAVVLAYVVPYSIVFGMYALTRPRLGVQLLPFLACAAAWTVSRIALAIPARRGVVLASALALLALAVPAAGTLRFVLSRWLPDTPTLAAGWVEENVGRSGERVQLVHMELPLFKNETARKYDGRMPWGSPWRSYQRDLAEEQVEGPTYDVSNWPLWRHADFDAATEDPLAYFREAEADYVMIPLVATPAGARSSPGLRIRQALREQAPLVARFPAEREFEDDVLLATDDFTWRVWAWKVLGDFRTNGAFIEVYRIQPREGQASTDSD